MPVSIELTTSQNGKIPSELRTGNERQFSINMVTDMLRMNEEVQVMEDALLSITNTTGATGKVAKGFEFMVSYCSMNLDSLTPYHGIDTQKHVYELREHMIVNEGQASGVVLSANESGEFET